MDLEIHSLETQLIGKVDGAVDPFVRDSTDPKKWEELEIFSLEIQLIGKVA